MSHDSVLNPFPGLRPFRTDEHHLFFGREEQVVELLGLLREHRFLAVVGTSGSGKSSLVRAGLIPALHRGTMTQAGSSWQVVVLRPGGSPITNLARALLEGDLYDAEDAEALPRLQATLSRSLYGLVEAVRQSDARDPDSNFLVVVDQFEEIFRFRQGGVDSEETAGAFVRLLLSASAAPEERIYVALTMRSDYLGDCSQIAGLAEAVNQGEYLVPRLSREQKRAAIEKPVGVGGARIAPRLVLRMLNDVGDDPDQLPVLQHALMRTFDAWAHGGRRDEPIDLDHYEGVGAMEEALSRHADEVFDRLPDDAHRMVCERLFRALSEKGADNRGTRRPQRLGRAVEVVGADRGIVAAVVEAYRAPGVTLITPGSERVLADRTVIDLSHESLMRIWSRLRRWVDEEAQSARIYRRLAETAALWRDGRAGLFRNPDLQIARSWRDAAQPSPAWGEQYGGGFEAAMAFLDESQTAADSEARIRDAARRHEIEQAHALAEAQRRRAETERRAARRMRGLSVAAGAVALVALAAFFVAVQARRDAQQNAELATASARLAAEKEQAATELAAELQTNLARSDFSSGADKLATGEGAEGLARLASALRTDPAFWQAGVRAMSVLASGRFPLRPTRLLEQEQIIMYSLFNAEAELLYTRSEEDEEKVAERVVWDAQTGERLYTVAPGRILRGATWSADGNRLYGFLPEENAVRAWEARSGKDAAAPIITDGTATFAVAVREDGSHLVLTRLSNWRLQVWRAGPTAEPLTGILGRDSAARIAFGFVPGGERIFAVSRDSTLAVWEAVGGAEVAEIPMRPHALRAATDIAFSPDGTTVLARVDDGKLVNWWRLGDPSPGDAWFAIEGGLEEGGWYFLPGGARVALTSSSLLGGGGFRVRVAVHDLATRQRVASVENSRPVSRYFLPAVDDGVLRFSLLGLIEGGNILRILDLETGVVLREITTREPLVRAMFSPEGRRVLTVSSHGEVLIWQILTGRPTLPAPIVHENLLLVDFSPDGELLVTTGAGRGLVQVWDTRSGQRVAEPVPGAAVTRLYFTAARRRLLFEQNEMTLSQGTERRSAGSYVLSDIGTRPALPEQLLEGAGAGVTVLGYSPDGAKTAVFGRTRSATTAEVLVSEGTNGSFQSVTPSLENAWELVEFSPMSGRIVVRTPGASALVLDIWTGETLHELPHFGSRIVGAALSADGARAATTTVEGKVRVWDLASGAPLGDPVDHGQTTILAISFSPDGTLLATGSMDYRFRIADGRSGKLLREPLTTTNVVTDLAFSRDGAHVAVVTFSKDVTIVEAATGAVVRELRSSEGARRAVFSPDGELLAVGYGPYLSLPAGGVHLWNWRSGQRVTQRLDTRGSVQNLEFSSDGALLATGTVGEQGGHVQVWDVQSGLPLGDPLVGRAPVNSLAFHPVGDAITVSWEDGTVRRIDLPPRKDVGSLARLARLAEAVARRRVAPDRSGVQDVPETELENLRREVAAGDAAVNDAYARWERWFLANEDQRTTSPASKLLVGDYLSHLRRSPDVNDLLEALRLGPTEARTWARLGLGFLDQLDGLTGELAPRPEVDAALRRHWESTAAWYSQRAIELGPEDSEVWTLHAEFITRLGRMSEASDAADRAVDLGRIGSERAKVNALYLQALGLAAKRQWDAADAALAASLEALSAAANDFAPVGDAAPLLDFLASIEPKRFPGGIDDLRLPPPIPGSFEDFDSTPEGQVPTGWTSRHDLPDLDLLAAESGRLDGGYSNVLDNWVAVSVERARRQRRDPFEGVSLFALGKPQRVDGVIASPLLSGRFLVAISAWRADASHDQILITPDFDCSGRAGVHVVFRSAYNQTPKVTASLEVSIDQGATWQPVFVRVPRAHLVLDAEGNVDAAATLNRPHPGMLLGIDERGRPFGGAHGDLLGSPIPADLGAVVEGRLQSASGETNRIEVYRLPRADGQRRVRLRFVHAGRRGYPWAIDDFGLYELPDGKSEGRSELLDATRDPGSLARLALLELLGRDDRTAALQDLPSLAFEAATAEAFQGVGAAATMGGAAGAAARRAERRRLAAVLLARRGAALLREADPMAGDVLNVLGLTLLGVGELDAAEAAAERLRSVWATVPRHGAGFYAALLRSRGAALESAGETRGAVVHYELAQMFHGVTTPTPDRRILDRLTAIGILAESAVLVPRGSEWRFVDSGVDPPAHWIDPAFDDSSWLRGKARFGYGDDNEVTRIDYGADPSRKHITTWFRTTFEVESPGRFAHLRLSLQRDDGVVIYLNGQEALRDNLPAGAIDSKTTALDIVSDTNERRDFVFDVPADLLREGRNVLAVEVHQQARDSSDLAFDLEVAAIGGIGHLDPAPAELDAIDERFGWSPELRSALWTARAERWRRGGKPERAVEALERALRTGPRNPSALYEQAQLLQSRGEIEAAYIAYIEAVEATIALKLGPPSTGALFLPETLASAIEPIVRPSGYTLAAAAERVARSSSRSRLVEADWLLRRSEALDPGGHEARLQRGEAIGALGRFDVALAMTEAAFAAGLPTAATPARAIRERNEWLGLRERMLRALGRNEEADGIRGEIFAIRPRDPRLDPKLIDLSAHYNGSLYDGRDWHGNQDLRWLPETFRPRGGIDFDLRGLIQLQSGIYPPTAQPFVRGRDFNTVYSRPYPERIEGVRVGLRAGALHFLASCVYQEAASGTVVARIAIRYEDGGETEFPIRSGEDVADWYFGIDPGGRIAPDRIVWIDRNRRRGLHLVTWTNPSPEKTIRELDIISAKEAAAPFFVAITAE